MVEVDHICIGVRNLYEATHRLREQTGFGTYEGGWFPRLGLANHIMPIGDDVYIEIETVVDAFELQAKNPGADWFHRHVSGGDVFIGWCARVHSREEVRRIGERLNAESVENGLRRRPDGSMRSALRVPETIPCWEAGIPNFFLHEDMATHPSRLPTEHGRVVPTGLAWMELGGTEAEMTEWLGVPAASLKLRFNDKAPGLYAMGINTDQGVVEIRLPSINGP